MIYVVLLEGKSILISRKLAFCFLTNYEILDIYYQNCVLYAAVRIIICEI